MTTAALPKPRARLAALLVFIGLPALLLTVSVLNILQIDDNSFVISEKEFQLSALKRKLATPGRDGKPLDLSEIYLMGGSATLASANLQQLIVKSIANTSGKLIETSVVETGDQAAEIPSKRVGIKASFNIDNPGLLVLLHRLESGVPLVFIDQISVRRLPSDDNGKDALRVDLEAYGRWKEAGP
jgi:hypothetical protein